MIAFSNIKGQYTLSSAVGSTTVTTNGTLVGVNSHLLPKIQVIQNAAARLVTGIRKYERITPVLRDLHVAASPALQRITYNTRQHCWCTSASTVWRQRTLRRTDVTFCQPFTLRSTDLCQPCLFHAPERTTGFLRQRSRHME